MVERQSPKLKVAGSSPPWPAITNHRWYIREAYYMNSIFNKKSLDKAIWLLVIATLVSAIWGNHYYTDIESVTWYMRLGGVVLAVLIAVGLALLTLTGQKINQLRKESVVEIKKVVWPTRQETIQTTIMVIVMASFAALIIYLMDISLRTMMIAVFGIGS